MVTLPDGTYDVIVVDAETTEDGDVRIELTVTLGSHVGRMVVLRGRHAGGIGGAGDDVSTLLGIPGTLRVHGGEPNFSPER